jgi:hypothetical protein
MIDDPSRHLGMPLATLSALRNRSGEEQNRTILRTYLDSLAGPPGIEPGTLTQERCIGDSFRVASQGFMFPEVKASSTPSRRHRCSTFSGSLLVGSD